jgi:hypothetical protein
MSRHGPSEPAFVALVRLQRPRSLTVIRTNRGEQATGPTEGNEG